MQSFLQLLVALGFSAYSVVIKNKQPAYIMLVQILWGHAQEEAIFLYNTSWYRQEKGPCSSAQAHMKKLAHWATRESRKQLTEQWHSPSSTAPSVSAGALETQNTVRTQA